MPRGVHFFAVSKEDGMKLLAKAIYHDIEATDEKEARVVTGRTITTYLLDGRRLTPLDKAGEFKIAETGERVTISS